MSKIGRVTTNSTLEYNGFWFNPAYSICLPYNIVSLLIYLDETI